MRHDRYIFTAQSYVNAEVGEGWGLNNVIEFGWKETDDAIVPDNATVLWALK